MRVPKREPTIRARDQHPQTECNTCQLDILPPQNRAVVRQHDICKTMAVDFFSIFVKPTGNESGMIVLWKIPCVPADVLALCKAQDNAVQC